LSDRDRGPCGTQADSESDGGPPGLAPEPGPRAGGHGSTGKPPGGPPGNHHWLQAGRWRARPSMWLGWVLSHRWSRCCQCATQASRGEAAPRLSVTAQRRRRRGAWFPATVHGKCHDCFLSRCIECAVTAPCHGPQEGQDEHDPGLAIGRIPPATARRI
jgi:hypothetical protein